jgi:hypothetical protein
MAVTATAHIRAILLSLIVMPASVGAEGLSPEPDPEIGSEPASDRGDLVDGLSALPLLEGGEDYNRRPEAVTYFTPVHRQQAWTYYAEHLRALGWEEQTVGSFVGDSGRQGVFHKNGAWLNVGIWIGNAHDPRLATRVNITHAGSVAADSLPRVDPIQDSVSCFPQVCVYQSSAAHEDLLQRLRERFIADGWQLRPVPPNTQRSAQAIASQLGFSRERSHLDIMIGPAPVEAGAEQRTAVQYVVSLAPMLAPVTQER